MIKIEIKTCEQYVLAELEEYKKKVDELEEVIEKLGNISDFLAALLYEYDPQWDSKILGEGSKIPS